MEYNKDISIVISLYNEAESLPELLRWIRQVMEKEGYQYEIIMVDDGSRDGSWEIIKEAASSDSHIRGISFRRNYGKSAALFHGFKAAEGRVVITMDADLQDSPEEIPEMYRMVTEEGFDIVSGWKKQRFDNKLTKNLPSKLYNATARRIPSASSSRENGASGTAPLPCPRKRRRNSTIPTSTWAETGRIFPSAGIPGR